jgi:aryl-alcohol dehydrogenase-like predicted oxidoreductase
MEYRSLGRSGLKVSQVCLGGNNWGGNTPDDEAVRILRRAFDAGVNFWDTAVTYSNGRSEEVIGRALKGLPREKVIVATKGWWTIGDGPNDKGCSRHYLVRAVEISLRRLGTDYIDLYYLHRPDPTTPIEESLSTLNDLIRQGKVRYLACSSFPAWQICEALWTARQYGWDSFVCEQPPYNILERGIEREVVPFCQKYGVALATYSPTASAWLTGRFRRGQPIPADSTRGRRVDPNSPQSQRRFDAVEKVEALARARGCSVAQFAIAWIMGHPAGIIPILGVRTMGHLEDNLGALEVKLSEEERKAVDEIAPGGARI